MIYILTEQQFQLFGDSIINKWLSNLKREEDPEHVGSYSFYSKDGLEYMKLYFRNDKYYQNVRYDKPILLVNGMVLVMLAHELKVDEKEVMKMIEYWTKENLHLPDVVVYED